MISLWMYVLFQEYKMINDIYIYTKKMKKVIDAVALIEALINQNKT